MLFLSIIFYTLLAASSLSALSDKEVATPTEQHSVDQKKNKAEKSYKESIIHGLAFGIASQYLHQEAFFESKVLRINNQITPSLALRYYLADELVADENVVHNICQGIGAIGTAYYGVCHKNPPAWSASDRETIVRSAIVHACDGSYDEIMSKDSFIFYKALWKTLVRCMAASTVWVCRNSGKIIIKSFKYQYGLFELLIPLVDLSEKLPVIRDWKKTEKKRVSRLIKSCMRLGVYTALALEVK